MTQKAATSEGPRVIKRYANRKLYDLRESCYITHDDIARMVRAGEDLKIIDNKTGEDLTGVTLSQILFDREKEGRRALPVASLREFFQSSGDFFQKHIREPVTSFRDEAEERVRRLFPGRAGAQTPAPSGTEAERADQEPKRDPIRELVESTQGAFESLQQRVEERIGLVTHTLRQFDAKDRRTQELEKRIARIEAHLGLTSGGEEA
jgi:polyhydroxyalkanoate synthesis repressor PhaR